MKTCNCQGDFTIGCLILEMEKIKALSPLFYQEYEDANLDSISGNEDCFEHLISSAPTEFARGLLIGRVL
jgi:hypothetical protein